MLLVPATCCGELEGSKGNKAQVSIKGYKEKIESKKAKICEDILDVLRQAPYSFCHLRSTTR